jgi:PIN domain nuclease of toxin-antitoxin system
VRALLDTQTFLWWNVDDPRLSAAARAYIAAPDNDLFSSAASAWEIAIKVGRGRLELPDSPVEYVSQRPAHHRFTPLPIQVSHALRAHALPDLHRDPFARLLVAQSQLEGLPPLTADPEIGRYDVDIIW